MSQLSKQTYVVVTRNFGVFHVTKEQAEKLDKVFDMPENTRPYRIEIEDDTKILLSQVMGITTAAKYEEIERTKKGEWKCSQGNWHDKFEKCKCGWGMDTSRKTDEEKESELTPEQKERAKLISDIRKKGITPKLFIKLGKMSNDELKRLLSSL